QQRGITGTQNPAIQMVVCAVGRRRQGEEGAQQRQATNYNSQLSHHNNCCSRWRTLSYTLIRNIIPFWTLILRQLLIVLLRRSVTWQLCGLTVSCALLIFWR